jgi:hypothetical protein
MAALIIPLVLSSLAARAWRGKVPIDLIRISDIDGFEQRTLRFPYSDRDSETIGRPASNRSKTVNANVNKPAIEPI